MNLKLSVIIVGQEAHFDYDSTADCFFEVWWPRYAFRFVKPGTFVLKEDYAVLVQATAAAKPWEFLWKVMTSDDKRSKELDSPTPIPIVSIGAVASSS